MVTYLEVKSIDDSELINQSADFHSELITLFIYVTQVQQRQGVTHLHVQQEKQLQYHTTVTCNTIKYGISSEQWRLKAIDIYKMRNMNINVYVRYIIICIVYVLMYTYSNLGMYNTNICIISITCIAKSMVRT